jgi:hypothetical protein
MSTFSVVVKWSPWPSVVSETLARPGRRDTGSQLNRNAEGLAVGRSRKHRRDWLGVMDSKCSRTWQLASETGDQLEGVPGELSQMSYIIP